MHGTFCCMTYALLLLLSAFLGKGRRVAQVFSERGGSFGKKHPHHHHHRRDDDQGRSGAS